MYLPDVQYLLGCGIHEKNTLLQNIQKVAARCITDEELLAVNEQICYHYETEIWKYAYLLMISLFEL